MKVRTRLRGAFALNIALLAGLSIFFVDATREAEKSGNDLAAIAVRLGNTSNVQLSRIAQVSSDADKYLVTHDTGYLDKARQTMRDFDDELRRQDTSALSGRERALIAPLKAEWDSAQARGSRLGGRTKSPRLDSAAVEEFQTALENVRDATEALGGATQDAMTQMIQASGESQTTNERITVLVAGGAVLLSLVLSALLARSIVKPLSRLAEGTREVSAGRFGHQLAARGTDELAQVTREFNVMTERLDELDRIKREFVSKVSHDLKTPLSSMQEANGVLLDELPGPLTPKQRQLLTINQESAQRLAAMLGKLLDLSRIEAGIGPERQVVDVRPLLRRCVERIAPGGGVDERVSLSMSDAPQRLLLRGDAEALIQVFDNLIDNALKFSPADGHVIVRVADLASRGELPSDRWAAIRRRGQIGPGPGAVLVTVADEGPGIADDEKDRVFDRFYQTDAGRAVRARGVGLGLAICREIVASHGGVIWVTDNEPRGSVFHVLLPGAVRVGAGDDSPVPALAADGRQHGSGT